MEDDESNNNLYTVASDAAEKSPSCWVIFSNAHDVFRSAVNEMEYDIRSGDPHRFEQFFPVWRRFQKFAKLHADMEECGVFRVLEGVNNRSTQPELVSWELHQADSDAAIKLDNILAIYQGRETFEKILPVFLSWQEIHFEHLDYEDKAWAPIINNLDMDTLRRNQIVYQMVTYPAHILDPNLCSEYYAWLVKNLSLYGTSTKNSLDSTVDFVRGLRCVCDSKQWQFYLSAIRHACTISIWDHLTTFYQIENPDVHANILSDRSIFGGANLPFMANDGLIDDANVSHKSAHSNSRHNSPISPSKWSISLVDVDLARASFSLVGTRGSFFRSKKIAPGTEWWTETQTSETEPVNSGKETAAVLSNSQSFRSASLMEMDSKLSLHKEIENECAEHTLATSHIKLVTNVESEENGIDNQSLAHKSYVKHPELDEFHFSKFILPFNKSKPSFHLRRDVSTMPVKLRIRPVIVSNPNLQPHNLHPAPFRSRVFAQILQPLMCCESVSAVDETAQLDKQHRHNSHHKKKKSGKKKRRKSQSGNFDIDHHDSSKSATE
jgi:hypothetical protein